MTDAKWQRVYDELRMELTTQCRELRQATTATRLAQAELERHVQRRVAA